jgi:hypothetical protein
MHRHLTYANVMATIGVFLALGGASYAAIKLPANSVGSKQIKDGAVTSADVKNHALKAGDFKGGLPSGPRGPRGPQGDKGAAAAKYWAQIAGGNTPTVTSSSGGVTAAIETNLAREVTFPANVSKCAIELTQVGGPALVTFRVISRPTGSTVSVWSSQSNGAGGVTTLVTSFDIAVFC